jgi:predicted N-acetyltransferase YhbS
MTAQACLTAPSLALEAERPQDSDAIEALLDRAFGPGRFVKSSERVREVAEFAPELSFCAWEDGRLVGAVRMWRVRVGETPFVFLGPLAVVHSQRNGGLGQALVAQACAAAEAAGERGVLLVGDPPYFRRAGFDAEHTAAVVMPGPVDGRRVLARFFAAPQTLKGPVRGR